MMPTLREKSLVVLLFSCLTSLVSGDGHLPHNVRCSGWPDVCSQLKGIAVGPARVGTGVIIDCIDEFFKPEEQRGKKIEWTVEKWILPNNETQHNVDERGRIHLDNLTESDTGIYKCLVLATIDDRQSPSANHTTHEALIKWPLKVYTPASDALEISFIWAANGVLLLLFAGLLFINERSLKSKLPLVRRTNQPKDNRIAPTSQKTDRKNSTKYGTLDTTQCTMIQN